MASVTLPRRPRSAVAHPVGSGHAVHRRIIRRRAVHAVLVAIAAAGAGVFAPWATRHEQVALVAVMAVVTLMPLIVRGIQGRFDPFEPIQIFAAGILVCFVARPIVELSEGLRVYADFFVRPGFNGAMLIMIVGTASLYIGYALPLGRRLGMRTPELVGVPDVAQTVRFATRLLAVGFLLFLLFVATSGGPSRVLTLYLGRSGAADDQILQNSSGWLYLGPYVTLPASLILLAAYQRVPTPRTLALLAVTITAALMVTVPRGDRTYVLALLLPLLVLPFLRKQRRPRVVSILVAVVLGITAINVLLATRNVATRQDPLGTAAHALVTPQEQIRKLLIGPDVSFFSVLELQYQVQPQAVPFQWGATPLSILSGPIPGRVWPAKPLAASAVISYYLFFQQALITRASNDSAMFGDFYGDGSWYLLAAYSILLGIALRWFYVYFMRHQDNASLQAIFASSLALMVILLRGALTDTIARSVALLGPLLLCAWLAGRPRGQRLPRLRRGALAPRRR